MKFGWLVLRVGVGLWRRGLKGTLPCFGETLIPRTNLFVELIENTSFMVLKVGVGVLVWG